MKKRKTFKLFGFILVVSILIVAGFLVYPEIKPKYKTYESTKYDFSFEYPKEWEIKEESNCHEFAQFENKCVSLRNDLSLDIMIEDGIEGEGYNGVINDTSEMEQYFKFDTNRKSILIPKEIKQNEFNGEYFVVALVGEYLEENEFYYSQYFVHNDKQIVFIIRSKSEITDLESLPDMTEIKDIITQTIDSSINTKR